MDLRTWKFTYGGKLTSRSISTEEEELSWNISSLHEGYEGKSQFKSTEFLFAEAVWVLFTTFAPDSFSFGIVLRTSSTSIEVYDCFCNVSFQNLDGEVFKSFKLKFKCGERRKLMAMKDVVKFKSSIDTQLKNGQVNAVVVCRLSKQRSPDISCSSENRGMVYFIRSDFLNFSYAFVMRDFTYCGTLTSKTISTEEEELTWDMSGWVHENRVTKGMSPDFSFAGSTWYLVANIADYYAIFGIDIRRRCSSDETFECCCNISLQNFTGKVLRSFEWKFQCDKTMPLISMRDYYDYPYDKSWYLNRKGVVIVCRITSKKLTTTGAWLATEIPYSGGSSAMEVCEPAHRPEQKNDGSSIVNPVYTLCQDLRQLLQSGVGSDVILQVGDQTFQAHRAILTARSSVFASMFCHDMKEKATGVVNIEDCDASLFRVFLEFLYCASTEKVSGENVFGLYTSSDKYDVRDLKMKCREYIKNNLSVESFCDTVRLSLRHSDDELLKFAINFFASNFKEITAAVEWQTFILENPIQSNEILIKAFDQVLKRTS